MINAAVLAAGSCGPAFKDAFGTEHKCLIPVAGIPMVERVVRCILETDLVDRLVVVGPADLCRSLDLNAEIIPNEEDSYDRTLACAARALGPGKALVIASDIPLLRPEDLEDWVRRCMDVSADLCIPVVSKQSMDAALPGARKTWYHLVDGEFTKGNAALADSSFFLDRLERIHNLFKARKEKKWTTMICQAFGQRVLSCGASLADVEWALSGYLGARVRSVSCAPELAVDVDEVTDVTFVESALRERARRQPCGLSL